MSEELKLLLQRQKEWEVMTDEQRKAVERKQALQELENLRKRAEDGEYLYAVEVAGKLSSWDTSLYSREKQTAAALLILNYFDRAYAMDKERACNAIEFVKWREILGDEYRSRIKHIDALVWKQLGRGMLGAIGDSLVDTAMVLPKILNITTSIRKLFGG